MTNPFHLILPLIGGLALSACTSLPDKQGPTETNSENPVTSIEAVSEFTAPSESANLVCDLHRVPDSNPDQVLIIQGGSGANLRSDLSPAVSMFLTDQLAVSICDRRGSGRSSGSLEKPGTLNSTWQIPLLAQDVTRIASALSNQGFNRIGVAGSSMGGWISIAAAARTELIDYVITINGGASPVAVSDAFDVLTDQGSTLADAIEQLESLDFVESYSPEADMAELNQPVLWLLGEFDTSNPTAWDLKIINRWIDLGKPFQTLVIEGVDHNFVNIESGQPELGWLPTVKAFAINGKLNG